jgi:hypothetical protein
MLLSVRKLGTPALATTMTRPQCPARKAGTLAHAVCQAENRNDYKRFDPRRLPIHRQPGNPFQGDHVAYFYQESDSVSKRCMTLLVVPWVAGMLRSSLVPRCIAKGFSEG